MRAAMSTLLLAAARLSSATKADEVPWKERHELVVTPWTGLPADTGRYANAEVIWTDEASLENCDALGCEITVFPFDQVCEDQVCQDLCPATSPFYAQPDPSTHCSGILVGEDLILTAGHCLNPAECPQQRIIFDYAVQFPGDPLGDPVDPGGETRFIPLEDIFECIEAEALSPFPPGTTPQEALYSEDRPAGEDWALMRLDRVVSQDRVPFPIERAAESAVGDPGLILGHPHRIPLKAEIQPLFTAVVGTPFHVLGGNSGSGVINLSTGKVIVVVTSGGMEIEPSAHPFCQSPPRYDLCFTCPDDVAGQGTLALAAVIPPIGLQVAPTVEVHHHGPPTSPAHFAWKAFSLSVPLPPPGEQPSRDVDWSFVHEGVIVTLEVQPGDPTSGHLEPGDPVTQVRLRPAQTVLNSQGLWTGLTAFFDQIYGTRTPVRHQIHVGVDGFTVAPTDAFDGADDLGVQHGAARNYRPANLWSVSQHLTVTAREEDPNDPNAPWPEWLELNGNTIPYPMLLPCKGCGTAPQLPVSIDGTDLDPGTYRGWIAFSSDDSGEPPYEITREVYFDHCREVFADPGLPVANITLQPGQSRVRTLTVSPPGSTSIADVDVITDLTLPPAGTPFPLQLWLQAPDGPPVFLKEELEDPLRKVWDEQTNRGASGDLDSFNNRESDGQWALTIRNDGSLPITFDFERFHVRLHHLGALPCD